MERAEFQIMFEATGADAEPLAWPIAPDGYIPNSVIRSWKKKGKKPWRDSFFHGLQQTDECTTSYEQDETTDDFWFYTAQEDERTVKENKNRDWQGNKGKKTEKEAEKPQEKLEVMRKEKTDVNKENGKDKIEHFVPLKPVQNIQTTKEEQQVVDSMNAVDAILTNRPPEQTLPSITPKVSDVSETKDSWLFRQPEKRRKRTERESEHEDTGEPERAEPQNETYSPSVAPLPQAQPELGHTEPSPIKDQRFLLFSAKYDNIVNHVEAAYDHRVLALYKKSKVFKKNLPYIGKFSGPTDYRPASKTTQSSSATLQTNTVEMSLKGGLYGPAAYRPSQSIVHAKSLGVCLSSDLGSDPTFSGTLFTTQIQPCCIINPEDSNYTLLSDYLHQLLSGHSTKFSQTFHSSQGLGHMTMTEWRKNLYKLVSLHGFQSPWTIRLLTREHAQKPPIDMQLVAAIPSLRPELAATHQRVVQKTEIKDTLEATACRFYQIVPMASLHSFVTVNLCGKTHYGQLEFDWMRGCDEEKLLNVSSLNTK